MQTISDTPIRILLVDDEEAFVSNLAKLLRLRDIDVTTAFDGRRAVQAVQEEAPFDVIVLDVKMPGMDGITALKELKRISPDSEVIMLTGHATLESGIQAMRSGAFDYLMKPCDIEDLCQKINHAYQTESIKRQPVLWQRSVVKAVENPFFFRLEEQDPAQKALHIFLDQPGTPAKETLYVVDAKNQLKGILTKKNLLTAINKELADSTATWQELAENTNRFSQLKVKDVMQPTCPDFTHPGESLTDVAQRMIAAKVRCMPVVDGGCLTGIIRLHDILKHIQQEIE